MAEGPVNNVLAKAKSKGLYISENLSGFPYKVNSLTENDIKESKNVVNNIKKHHWNNGPNKAIFNTTNNEYLKYDSKGAKVANIPLTEEHKNNLRESHCELGKGKMPFISTQFNSYLPNNNIQTTKNSYRLKNSSIDFNPNFNNINGNTIYMRDY